MYCRVSKMGLNTNHNYVQLFSDLALGVGIFIFFYNIYDFCGLCKASLSHFHSSCVFLGNSFHII